MLTAARLAQAPGGSWDEPVELRGSDPRASLGKSGADQGAVRGRRGEATDCVGEMGQDHLDEGL